MKKKLLRRFNGFKQVESLEKGDIFYYTTSNGKEGEYRVKSVIIKKRSCIITTNFSPFEFPIGISVRIKL